MEKFRNGKLSFMIVFTVCIFVATYLAMDIRNKRPEEFSEYETEESFEDPELLKNLSGEGFFYVKKDGMYRYSVDDNKKEFILDWEKYEEDTRKSKRDLEEKVDNIQKSKDGKYIYYLNKNTLQRLDLEDNSESIIEDYVDEFKLLENGKLIVVYGGYLTTFEGRTLDVYDLENGNINYLHGKLHSYFLSEDEKNIFSTETDDSVEDFSGKTRELGKFRLYDIEEDKVYVSDENVYIDEISYINDMKTLSYVKRENGKDSLYFIKDAGEFKTGGASPHLVATAEEITSYVDKQSGLLYYLSKQEENSLYKLLINDDLDKNVKEAGEPNISEEDKELMFKNKRIIEGKGLKEYALKKMADEFKENIKNEILSKTYGTLYCYDGNEAVELSDSALLKIEDTVKGVSLGFTHIEKDRVKKLSLTELFSDYVFALGDNAIEKTHTYEDLEDYKKEKRRQAEYDMDSIIYAYYADNKSPLGEYFNYTDKQDDGSSWDLDGRFFEWENYKLSENTVKSFFEIYKYENEDIFTLCCIIGSKAYKTGFNVNNVRAMYIGGDKIYLNIVDVGDRGNESIVDNFNSYFSNKAKIFFEKRKEEILYTNGRNLYMARLNGDVAGEFELLDSNIQDIIFSLDEKIYYERYSGEYYEVKGIKYRAVDLCCDGEKLAEKIEEYDSFNNMAYIYLREGKDDVRSLYDFDGKEFIKISDDIAEQFFLKDGTIFYRKGDNTLKCWKKGTYDEVVDKEVEEIIFPNTYKYSSSYADTMKNAFIFEKILYR